jgi:hypothetical protein
VRLRRALALAALLAIVPTAPAVAETDTTTVPFSELTDNPCNGDLVQVIGLMHLVVIAVEPHAGGFRITLESNTTDTTGTSILTGTEYQASHETVQHYVYTSSSDDEADAYTLVHSTELVSLGPESNFILKIIFRAQLDVFGEPADVLVLQP